MAVEVEVSGPGGLPAAEVERLVRTTVRAEDGAAERISVSFVGPDAIRQLNATHRDINRPTDVLSYPFDASFPHGAGGEVVICPEVVRRYADRDGRGLEDRLQETVIHGVLHLLGHEDGTDAGAGAMAERTARIMMETSDG
ncbi:MAG: rRNA maturation RNase YbeY [Patescibacteria group bacterium]